MYLILVERLDASSKRPHRPLWLMASALVRGTLATLLVVKCQLPWALPSFW